MARQFSTMKSNVANDIGDTTTTMKTRIGRYLNKRHNQVLRMINWQQIDDDYTVSVVSGTQDYNLPAVFGHEIACTDTTNDTELTAISLGRLYELYPDPTANGTVQRYCIWTDDSGQKKIKFHYKPTANITVALPHTVKPADMSADGDTPVLPFGDMLEAGARADAWRQKRQFAKAATEETLFEKMLADYIWEQDNQPNKIFQFNPQTFDRDNLY